MPLVDINKPEVIKFLVESYEKATRLRMKWNTTHADKLNQASALSREEKGYYEADVVKATIVSGMGGVTTDNLSGARNKRVKAPRDGLYIPRVADLKKGHTIVDVGLGDPKEDPRLAKSDTDLTSEPIMRPVNPEQHEIIYKGKPNFGRQVYLSTRVKSLIPEKRYYFAETSSWVHGWRLKDSYFNTNVPKHGRVWRLAREKSLSGPQPDPLHYKSLARGPNKCLES